MTETKPKLLLVGCGKMGSAILRGVNATLVVAESLVIDPAPLSADILQSGNVVWLDRAEALGQKFEPDIVVLAIKPQVMAEIVPHYARFHRAVFLSIAAGITLHKISEMLKAPAAAIVRIMPNLPASIGQGMSVAVANSNVTERQHTLVDQLLRSVGQATWTQDEALLDVVTALSGSGPAYIFALCEVMARVGESMGLAPAMAQQLARQTIVGSGALLAATTENAAALRHAVTSPRGTTEAALEHLLGENGLEPLMAKTMQAAAARAKELAF